MINSKIITIDGPSGVGKGTLARKLAKKLNYDLLDSGAIYRLAGLHCYLKNIDSNNENNVFEALSNFNIKFKIIDDNIEIYLNNKNVTSKIRTEEFGMLASKIAKYNLVRKALLDKQKSFATDKGLVADGRDMGTVVFKDSKYKFFLDASPKVRATRRFKELISKGQNPNYNKILEDIKKRDFQDRNRKVAPLIPADDAIIIDSSNMTIDEVFNFVLSKIT